MMHKSTFFDFFPPPQFLTMPSAGLAISDRTIRFVELVRKGSHFAIGKYGEKAIPEGVVVGGVIKESEVLVNLLSQLKKEHKLTFVRVSISEQQGYVVTLTMPYMKKKELRGSIELQLEEHIPIPPQSVVFDYTYTVCHKEERKNFEVGVSAISQTVVQSYLETFDGAGFIPLSLEIESQATARSVVPYGDCGTYMIVDIGARRTGISIVSHRIIQFTWTLSTGGDLLTEIVSRAFHVDFEKAREIKERLGLVKKDEKDMLALLSPIALTIRDEIAKRVNYWNTHKEAVNEEGRHLIAKIILCGGEANVPGLPQFLGTGVTVPVAVGNPWINIVSFNEYIPEISSNQSLRYATVLGLALRSFYNAGEEE